MEQGAPKSQQNAIKKLRELTNFRPVSIEELNEQIKKEIYELRTR